MISERLNKRENEVMGAVFLLADGKERFLLFPYELLSVLPPRAKYDEETLDRALEICTVTERKKVVTTFPEDASTKEFTDYLLETIEQLR